jgi:hypothetical protein
VWVACGRAMAQVVILWHLTTEAPVRAGLEPSDFRTNAKCGTGSQL